MHDKPVWKLVKKQRAELADFLVTLSQTEWDTPSLCRGWRVRDVVAHIILESRYTQRNSTLNLIRHGFNLNRFMFDIAVDLGKRSPEDLVGMLREDIEKEITPFMTKPSGVLADLLVHEQDIRIALGKEKKLNQSALKQVFSTFSSGSLGIGEYLVGVRKNIKGMKLIAKDIEWGIGNSQLVIEGTSQDILMAIAGRPSTLSRLKGSGVGILADRIGAS